MPEKPITKSKVTEKDPFALTLNRANEIKEELIDLRKKQAKAKVREADLFGLGFVELSTKAFKEAVEEVWERQRQKKQDSYGTIDGDWLRLSPMAKLRQQHLILRMLKANNPAAA